MTLYAPQYYTFTITGAIGISPTTSSATAALPTTAGDSIEITNEGTAAIYIKLGTSSVTATVATGTCVAPGQSKLYQVGSATHIAHITRTGTAFGSVSRGNGV